MTLIEAIKSGKPFRRNEDNSPATQELLWCIQAQALSFYPVKIAQGLNSPKKERNQTIQTKHGTIEPWRLERFISSLRVSSNDCIEWTGKTVINGYGSMSAYGKPTNAHRISWFTFVGEIPSGLVLDHLCRNRSCVRPDHLRAISLKENILCGAAPPALNATKTHCTKGHEYTDKTTYRWRGYRYCRPCHSAYTNKKRKEKLMAAKAAPEGWTPDSGRRE